MNYNIAVCDDDPIQVDLMARLLEEIGQTRGIVCQISTFLNGEELLSELEHDYHFFHIIFLDIEMGQGRLTGIDTAHVIRKFNQRVLIAFVSGFREYVFNAYEVSAFRYLLKPTKKEKLEPLIDAFITKMKSREKSKFVEITSQRGRYVLNQEEIRYFEKNRNVVTAYLKTENIEFYSTLGVLMKELDTSRFIQIHQGYIVHIKEVAYIAPSEVILKDGAKVPLSRRRIEAVKKMLLESMREDYE